MKAIYTLLILLIPFVCFGQDFLKIIGYSLTQFGNDIIKTNDGNILIAGYNGDNDERDGLLVKLNYQGEVIWQKNIGGYNLDQFHSVIDDNGFYYKTMVLRNAYDVFLLSKKTNAKDAVNSLDKLVNPLNCFLAACNEIFNSVDSLEYSNTKKTASYLIVFKNQFVNSKKTKRRHIRVKAYLFLKSRLKIIYKSIIYKEYRDWLFKRVTDKNWHKEKLIKLGIKKQP